MKTENRAEELRARRNAKMGRSAQTYIRGSTTKFYEWLEANDVKLPQGPAVWICGDCHYGNLGPIANADGQVEIQIRDLDQTVVGNPAHDLIRLTLSLAGAARGFDLPGSTTARMVEAMVGAYQAALTSPRRTGDNHPPLLKGLVQESKRRTWDELAHERINGTKPAIPLGKRFWALDADERRAIKDLVASDTLRELVTMLEGRPDDAEVELLDAAFWVKGCSSLGLLRYSLLIGVVRGKHRETCLIDIKEAIKAAAPRVADAPMPRDNAERVVTGARQLSPFLGERMRAARLLDKPVFIRELRPQDLKLELGQMGTEDALCVAAFLAGVVGRAHAGQLDANIRKSWAAELGRNRSKTLDAPSWLWSSVVDLLGMHEAAYLEHCRRYARIAA